MWTEKPFRAFRKYIRDHLGGTDWVNDGSPISAEVPLRKRELYGLIALAHMYNKDGGSWIVGYDSDQPEPNDGLITDGERVIRVEQKVITEYNKAEVLEEILATYHKYRGSVKGSDYGRDRTLIISINKPASHGGMIKISALTDEIEKVANEFDDECIFERVYTLSQMAATGTKGHIHMVQHFPKDKSKDAQIDFDFVTGRGQIPHCKIDL